MGSFVLFSTKFNSNIYSFFCFATNSIQKLIQFSFFNKIQFKSWFNSLVSNKIQFKNIFKMLKLAVFNSIKYSFNMKTWVSDRATVRLHLWNLEGSLNVTDKLSVTTLTSCQWQPLGMGPVNLRKAGLSEIRKGHSVCHLITPQSQFYCTDPLHVSRNSPLTWGNRNRNWLHRLIRSVCGLPAIPRDCLCVAAAVGGAL